MELYKPDIYKKDIFSIPYEQLKERGIRYLIFDYDNTLLPVYEERLSDKTIAFLKSLQSDFTLFILSNSSKKRFSSFDLDITIIPSAFKPNKKNYLKLLDQYPVDQIAVIGDQLMTDIKGGNRVGIMTILVDPLDKKERFWTKINRFFEKKQMEKLARNDLFFKGRYYE